MISAMHMVNWSFIELKLLLWGLPTCRYEESSILPFTELSALKSIQEYNEALTTAHLGPFLWFSREHLFPVWQLLCIFLCFWWFLMPIFHLPWKSQKNRINQFIILCSNYTFFFCGGGEGALILNIFHSYIYTLFS